MQRIILSLSFILTLFICEGKEDEIKLRTSISEVTVYQQSALIHREGKINVPAGNSSVILYDLNRNINPGDIRISAQGDFQVLSISYRYHTDTISGKDGQSLRDQLFKQMQDLQDQVKRENSFLEIYNKEEQMLLANQNFTHKEEGVDIDRLAKASDFLRTRLFDIKQKRMEIEDLVNSIQEDISNLMAKQNAIVPLRTETTLEMIVRVNADSQVRGTFYMDYRAHNAGWKPSYDATVEKISEPLTLEYKAKVYQNTGEDWDDIELTVATGNPNTNKKKPNLLPWYLSNQSHLNNSNVYQNQDYNSHLRSQPLNSAIRVVSGQLLDIYGEPLPFATVQVYGVGTSVYTDINGYYSIEIPNNGQQLYYSYAGYLPESLYISNAIMNVILKSPQIDLNSVNSLYETQEKSVYLYNQGLMDFDSGSTIIPEEMEISMDDRTDYAQVAVAYSPINTKFKIDAIYSIPSNGREYAVQIQEHEMDADYMYQCSPKLDLTAYLTAQVTDWEELNLLDGPMNIYFEEAFIGTSRLDLKHAEDTLNLSLGEDKNISIERRRVKSEHKKQGSHKKVLREFEIIIRNNKRENITILIEDQVPITTTDEIDIEAETLSGGSLDELTGKVQWEVDLNSGKKKILRFKYSVKHPKTMRLNV